MNNEDTRQKEFNALQHRREKKENPRDRFAGSRETPSYKEKIARDVRSRIFELRQRGVPTSKGEPMSMASIGRTLDPPVHRVSVLEVVDGRTVSDRIRRAIEHELGRPYWIKKKTKP